MDDGGSVKNLLVRWLEKALAFLRQAAGVSSAEVPTPEDTSPETFKAKIAILREQVAKFPEDPVAHFNLGVALVHARHFPEALSPLKETIRLNPEHPSAEFQLGAAYLGCGRDNDAVDVLQGALKKHPDSAIIRKLLAEANTNLAAFYGKLRQYDEALKYFEAAIAARAEFGPAYLTHGINLMEQGRYKESLEEFSKALQRDKMLGLDVNYYRGIVYGKLGELKKSVKYLQLAVDTGPEAALAHQALGLAYFKQGKFAAAADMLRKAYRINPKQTPDAPFKLGLALVKLERHAEAIEPLLTAHGLAPEDATVLEALINAFTVVAEKFHQEKNLQKEVETLKGLLEVEPERIPAHVRLTQAFDQMNKGIDAIVHTIILKQLYFEQGQRENSARAQKSLDALYQKYNYKPENFVNVKVPRKQHGKE